MTGLTKLVESAKKIYKPEEEFEVVTDFADTLNDIIINSSDETALATAVCALTDLQVAAQEATPADTETKTILYSMEEISLLSLLQLAGQFYLDKLAYDAALLKLTELKTLYHKLYDQHKLFDEVNLFLAQLCIEKLKSAYQFNEEALQDQIADMQLHVFQLQAALEETQNLKRELSADQTQSQEKISKLTSQIASLQTENFDFSQLLSQRLDANHKLGLENLQLQISLGALQGKTEIQIGGLQATRDDLQTQLTTLTAQNSAVSAELNKITAELTLLKETLRKEYENNALSGVDGLKQQLAFAHKTIGGLKSQLGGKDKEILSLQGQVQRLTTRQEEEKVQATKDNIAAKKGKGSQQVTLFASQDKQTIDSLRRQVAILQSQLQALQTPQHSKALTQ